MNPEFPDTGQSQRSSARPALPGNQSPACPGRSPQLAQWLRGFSLVEIVICLGIISFAFVAIMGLLPVGLRNFRGALDATTGAQIFQRVMNDAKQTDFSKLVPTNGTGFYVIGPRYFDDQGNEKLSAAGAIYHVRIRGSRPGQGFASLPGTASRYTPANTTFLTVQIVNNPGNRTVPVDTNSLWQPDQAAPLPMSTYSGIVTRR